MKALRTNIMVKTIVVALCFFVLIVGFFGFYIIKEFQTEIETFDSSVLRFEESMEKMVDIGVNNDVLDNYLYAFPMVEAMVFVKNQEVLYSYIALDGEVITDTESVATITTFSKSNNSNIFALANTYLYKFFDGQDKASFLNSHRTDQKVRVIGENKNIVRYSYEGFESRMSHLTARISVFLLASLILGGLVIFMIFVKFAIPLRKIKKGAHRIAEGNLREPINVSGHDEIGIIGTFFNEVARNLQSIMGELIEKDKLTNDMNIAQRIQSRLLPKEAPDIPGLDITAANKTADAVGGDAFSYIPVDEKNILLYVADVTGHGIPAGLIMTMTDILVHGFSDDYRDIRELLVKVNKHLTPKIDPAMFVTLLMLNWNHEEQKITYAGAGHESIMHYRAKEKKVNNIIPGGIALGMIPDNSKLLKIGEITPEVGDVIVMYTDGIVEAWGGENGKELYGMDRMISVVEKFSSFTTSQAIFNAITKDLADHMQDYEQQDDITLMVIKYVGIGDHEKGAVLDIKVESQAGWGWDR